MLTLGEESVHKTVCPSKSGIITVLWVILIKSACGSEERKCSIWSLRKGFMKEIILDFSLQ